MFDLTLCGLFKPAKTQILDFKEHGCCEVFRDILGVEMYKQVWKTLGDRAANFLNLYFLKSAGRAE